MTPTSSPRKPVDPAHPVRIPARQVVVHRDHVDALARERVQDGRESGHQGLPLAGLHLGDAAPVEDGAAEELHIEVPHPEGAAGGFAGDGEDLGHEVLEGFPGVGATPKRPQTAAEPNVVERLHFGLERPDGRPPAAEAASVPARTSCRRSS